MKTISVVMPALNEQDNISKAVTDVLAAFDRFCIAGELIVINDGSTDATAAIARGIAAKDSRVRVVDHGRPMGIGASFWDGAEKADGEAVCLMPGDNEIDPAELLRYCYLLTEVDIVVPFFYNKRIRGFVRTLLSDAFRFIINSSFGTSFNYSNGAVIYRRSVLLGLSTRVSGFFYQTDILVRLVRGGYLYAEVPAKLRLREGGVSKAISAKSLGAVTAGYLRLARDMFMAADARTGIQQDSVTYKRTER
jgi:dolichol-phosphate mannosyltransferase